MKRTKDYYEYWKSFSLYLNPTNRNSVNGGIMQGNVPDLENHLAQVNKKIPALKIDLEGIDKEFEQHRKMELQKGNEPVTELTPLLLQKQSEINAKMKVHKEEIKWLETKIKEAKVDNNIVERRPISHPKDWGSAVLKDNIMLNIGGHETSVNKDGILFISDERSPYQGMLVWRFKSQVAVPLHAEYRYRLRQESKNALDEKRDRKMIRYPNPPVYDKKTGKVTYPNYSKTVVKKYQTA